jgi:thiamine biosynthesis lipoprotein
VTDAYVRTIASMGTVVTVHIVTADETRGNREEGAANALAWFDQVERVCSRFDPTSELSQLSTHIGERVAVSDLLFEVVRFAIAVAEESGGAFDPTLGLELEARGFNREHRSGAIIRTPLERDGNASYRDVELNVHQRTIMLTRPLLLDLGAVAKGLAVDMAAKELERRSFANFAIDAGGDLYLSGHNADDRPWSVGIRHPRRANELLETIHVSNVAVCTSGDYEQRTSNDEHEHHIIDPRTRASAAHAASVTVLGPSAMVADALATAAFVLGPGDGIDWLERHGVDGMIVTPSLERFATRGMHAEYCADRDALPDSTA